MKKALIVGIVILCIGATILFLFPDIKKSIDLDNGPPLIGVQPLGSVPQVEVDSVASAIEKMYGFEVQILDRKELPEMAYTEIRYPRYRADSLVKWLTQENPDTIDIIIGLTHKDISITKYDEETKQIKEPEYMYKDFGIFGLGQVKGTACIVSSNRLHKNVSNATFYKRLMRITCHEVGHVLGLKHCPEPNCLMNDANESIRTIDKSTGVLCEECVILIDINQ